MNEQLDVGILDQLSGHVDDALVYVCMSLSGTHTLIDNQPIAFCSLNGLNNI